MKTFDFIPVRPAVVLFCAAVGMACALAEPLGTAFTYQGRFQDAGSPAQGSYDLRFTLCDNATNGTVVAATLTNSSVPVVNGAFTVSLDFGGGIFAGEARWLEIAVRTNGLGAFITLAPRISMPATPHALFALRAGAAQTAESVTANAVSTAGLQTSSITADKLAAGQVVRSLNGLADAVILSAGSNIVLTPLGNGLQISAVPVSPAGVAWSLTGNSGTTPGPQFLGTADNRALELKVNNQRALRLEPAGNSPNVIGGHFGNMVASGVSGAVIAGGGGIDTFGLNRVNRTSDHFTTISGGNHNRIDTNSPYAAIAGGFHNWIQPGGAFASIGGGEDNTVAGASSVLAGGSGNTIEHGAFASAISGGYDNQIGANGIWNSIAGGWFNVIEPEADSSSIGGGSDNRIQGAATGAAIPGGQYNVVAGDHSLAAGYRAQALHSGTFVWGDSTSTNFASTSTNQFLIRAAGGVGIGTNAPQSALHVVGTITADAFVGNAMTASNFTGPLTGDVTGIQGATVVSTVGGQSAANVASGAVLANGANPGNVGGTIVKRDSSGNFSAGLITANLAGNATMATTAGSFSGGLAGDVVGTQTATVVESVGGQPASSVASGTSAANTATNANTAGAIVKRGVSGEFSSGAITASSFAGNGAGVTSLNATNISAGTLSDARLSTNMARLSGNQLFSGSNQFSGVVTAPNASNTFSGSFTGSLNGNAATATAAGSFTNALAGDVTGTQGATVVAAVGGLPATDVASGAQAANNATSGNLANFIVKRGPSGEIYAGSVSASTFTGSLSGHATTAGGFTGSLSGDVTGTQGSTVVSTVGGQTAGNIASGANLANGATSANTGLSLVRRDSSGNFSAGVIAANLAGNATTAGNFTGPLSGEVTGTQGSTVVSSVGGQTAAAVASGVVLANNATVGNVVNSIVRRGAAGEFYAGAITASSLSGNGAGVTNVNAETLEGQHGAYYQNVGNLNAGTLADARLSGNVALLNTIQTFTASNQFAGVLIATNANNLLSGNLTGNASTATSFTGSLLGDVTGTQGSTVISTVGGQSAANVASGSALANAATTGNVGGTIARRDASGNFTAGIITASLSGNASTATTAGNFTGSLSGDVTGTQSSSVVSSVGGQSAANIGTGTAAANAATSVNAANTIVKRDASGNFTAGTISAGNFSGSGANLSGLNASQVTSGTLPLAQLSGVVVTNNKANVTLNTVTLTGDTRMDGLVWAGSQTNTSEPPDKALMTRRIKSVSVASGSVVARTDKLTLERDGTYGGFRIAYTNSPGNTVIACMGVTSTGAATNFVASLANPSTNGTVMIYANSANVVFFRCSFGDSFNLGHLTEVSLTRHPTDYFWTGTVTSTYNQ